MSKKVHTVAPDESLHMIAMLMSTYKISRVVIEKNRKPVGIVTSRDFLPISLVYGTSPYGRHWATRSNGISAKIRQKFHPIWDPWHDFSPRHHDSFATDYRHEC